MTGRRAAGIKGKQRVHSAAALTLLSLEDAAGRAGLEIRYSNLEDEEMTISSGVCWLQDRRLLLVDKRLGPVQRAGVIATVLSQMDLENIYLPPATRMIIEEAAKR